MMRAETVEHMGMQLMIVQGAPPHLDDGHIIYEADLSESRCNSDVSWGADAEQVPAHGWVT